MARPVAYALANPLPLPHNRLVPRTRLRRGGEGNVVRLESSCRSITRVSDRALALGSCERLLLMHHFEVIPGERSRWLAPHRSLVDAILRFNPTLQLSSRTTLGERAGVRGETKDASILSLVVRPESAPIDDCPLCIRSIRQLATTACANRFQPSSLAREISPPASPQTQPASAPVD